ncbi:MAG: bifunctional ADP-dependent NAD(P)H-hydrate dehydratase/NAD(P)H-hydrate epimerase, partial [Gracilibacteraceae bacterium]|nr:bifunctional ADP-dependent NAD(P)H-hydrate dehydratase/NAD(P)H-hydrate epimerase [Gracilibacteraceae bacterium]
MDMRLATAEQMRRIDARAIGDLGLPGIVLMENAALAIAAEAETYLPGGRGKTLILAGRGNNGGDG